jgi:mannose-6-phosphate isomerase-like protein (cupin superfamily)
MLASDHRPWGTWEEYLNERNYRVKRITVEPGRRLSLQKHKQRSENWVIVAGNGRVRVDATERDISVGDTVSIPLGAVHRVENTGTDQLVIIETQLGVCVEEDVVRIEDDWGRK